MTSSSSALSAYHTSKLQQAQASPRRAKERSQPKERPTTTPTRKTPDQQSADDKDRTLFKSTKVEADTEAPQSRTQSQRKKRPQKQEKATPTRKTAHKKSAGEEVRIIRLSDKERAEGKDGLLDVYNYAALYGCIPQSSAKQIKNGKKKRGTAFEVSIMMPEQDIKVNVKCAGELPSGQIAAAREFKRQAELYHQKKGTDSVVVKDSTALTTENASQFFAFCKDRGEPESRIEISTTQEKHNIWVSTPMLDDLALSPDWKVTAHSRSFATTLGYLIAAIAVTKEKPQLLADFAKALHAGNGKYLGKVKNIDMLVSYESLEDMRDLEQFASRHDRYIRDRHSVQHQPERQHAHQTRREEFSDVQLAEKSAELQARVERYHGRADLEQLRHTRFDLPMSQYAPQVREIVQNNIYCVIIGATGSGKTTQVPQILLDQAIENGTGASCNVVCTQPRRIAATSVAKRVANERAENLQDTVGYQVRFDARLPKPGGSILYCTTGILLQQLQHSPDEVYDHVSHLVIDEVHERDMIIDFLLIILKKTMAARVAQGKKVPRVVLMSATIDAERFAAYFSNCLPLDKSTDCPTLSVPGRTFPVKELYLETVLEEMKRGHGERSLALLNLDRKTREYLVAEQAGLRTGLINADNTQESVIDWKSRGATGGDGALQDNKDDALVPLGLAALTIAHIAETTENGAILVFLPGLDDIVKLDEMLRDQSPLKVNFNDADRFQIFMLHSSIPDSQKTVFDPLPHGCRKIILSTNIAETSVTIPDVQFVVDTGKSREKRYDQTRRITSLQCTWISKSNAKQRAGRAGRVQNGNYYALFTRSRRESMRAIGLPELLRSDLQEICLDIKTQAFKMPTRDFLAEAIEPPSPVAVDTALRSLTTLGALTEEEELTPLGRLLASLPVHPSLGKMIVLGIIFRCLDPMIILGAAAHERSLLINSLDRKREQAEVKKKLAGASQSDHMVVLNTFRIARKASTLGYDLRGVSDKYFIHRGAFNSIESTARQIEQILVDAQLIESSNRMRNTSEYGGHMLNENSGSEEVVKALLLAGLLPNVAVQTSSKGRMFRTSAERHTFIHPSSVNASKTDEFTRDAILTYTSLALSSDGGRMNMRDTTFVEPLTTLLFGGRLSHKGPVVEVDGWLPFWTKTNRSSTAAKVDGYNPSAILVFFRKKLDAMLEAAFHDLAKKVSLADDPLRQKIATGLARILTREAGTTQGSHDGGRPLQDSSDRNFHGHGRPSSSYRLDPSRRSSSGRADNMTPRFGRFDDRFPSQDAFQLPEPRRNAQEFGRTPGVYSESWRESSRGRPRDTPARFSMLPPSVAYRGSQRESSSGRAAASQNWDGIRKSAMAGHN